MSNEGFYQVPDDMEFGQTIRGFSPGQQVFGRYTLQRIVGRGGMGLVWLAQDEQLQEEVALKFLPELVRLDEISLEELKRETRRSRKLAHTLEVVISQYSAAHNLDLVIDTSSATPTSGVSIMIYVRPTLPDITNDLIAAANAGHSQ